MCVPPDPYLVNLKMGKLCQKRSQLPKDDTIVCNQLEIGIGEDVNHWRTHNQTKTRSMHNS